MRLHGMNQWREEALKSSLEIKKARCSSDSPNNRWHGKVTNEAIYGYPRRCIFLFWRFNPKLWSKNPIFLIVYCVLYVLFLKEIRSKHINTTEIVKNLVPLVRFQPYLLGKDDGIRWWAKNVVRQVVEPGHSR